MSTAILLIRHGETAWNRGRIFRGVRDIPLNENGRAQARLAAQSPTLQSYGDGAAPARRRVDAAYSSPLSRAVETAKIVLGPHGIEAAVHEGLKDFNYGEWTGLEESEVARKWPAQYARWSSEPHKTRPPGGDTLQEVFDRSFAALEEIALKHDGQTVAVFGHRVVNKLLVLGMLSLGLERFPFIRQDNCCISEFERAERGYIVVRLNDTSHIRQAGAELLEADF